MGSSDELVAKLRGGSAANYDVISPSSDVAASIVRAGTRRAARSFQDSFLCAALRETSRFSLVKANGQAYGVPFMWGPNPLLYDTSVLSRSRRIPGRFSGTRNIKGKILLVGRTFQRLHGRAGSRLRQARPSQLYNLTDAQLEAVKKKLIELKPNIRKFWSTGGELTNLFQNHEVVARHGLAAQRPTQLRKFNFPIGETIPKENTTGWIDHLMITAASTTKGTRHSNFSQYMVEAKHRRLVTDVTHYTPANPGAASF